MSKKKTASHKPKSAQSSPAKTAQPASRVNQKTSRKAAPAKLQPWMVATIILVAIAAVAAVALVLTNLNASKDANVLPASITVEEAFDLYNEGAFVLDVRTQEEWDDYHAPNTTLIPLDQLSDRLSELDADRQIVVICRSGNRSQEARDILLQAGFNATSVNGGLNDWRAAGYPIE